MLCIGMYLVHKFNEITDFGNEMATLLIVNILAVCLYVCRYDTYGTITTNNRVVCVAVVVALAVQWDSNKYQKPSFVHKLQHTERLAM